jgi:hypothetical protein
MTCALYNPKKTALLPKMFKMNIFAVRLFYLQKLKEAAGFRGKWWALPTLPLAGSIVHD